MIAAFALLLATAAPEGHRARGERAEALGRMDAAAREYEAAYDEDSAPDLLWRLAVVHRKLKHYSKAREALRGYLRAAPDGPLRFEVERQLARIEVLLEAQQDDFEATVPRSTARAATTRPLRTARAKRTTPRSDLLSIDDPAATPDLLPLPPDSAGARPRHRTRP